VTTDGDKQHGWMRLGWFAVYIVCSRFLCSCGAIPDQGDIRKRFDRPLRYGRFHPDPISSSRKTGKSRVVATFTVTVEQWGFCCENAKKESCFSLDKARM
jgi:hypothetical protein